MKKISLNEDLDPEIQVLMAAVIRLMARCATTPEEGQIRTLVRLLSQLREHPDLRRDPAVRAALAESHFAWIERRALAPREPAAESPPCARDAHKLH